MHQAGTGTQLGKLPGSGPGLGDIPGDHSQGSSLSPDHKLKQMKPDGKILLKLFCFQTFIFMVCCHDVRICQGVRKNRACQKKEQWRTVLGRGRKTWHRLCSYP